MADESKTEGQLPQHHHEEDAALSLKATKAANTETQMSVFKAIKVYPKAVGWSILLSTAVVMEGYDVSLIGSFFAYTTFQEHYGSRQSDGTYQISAAWQSGLSNGALCGEILGLAINGYISECFGYRRVMIASLALLTAFIFIPFFAKNLPTLLVGFILQGIPWGIFQTLTTAYASEVCPTALRAYLTTYVNICWVIGQLLASGVLRALLGRTDEWAYRIPYALQWMWPVPLIVGIFLAPESPWWLVRHGKIAEARASLKRLTSTNQDEQFNIDDQIALMVKTNELEREISAGTSYLDCFKGVNLRRTEISCLVWAIQVLCGSAFMGYSTYFYEQAGLNTANAFDLTMGQYALGFIGTFCSWWLISRLGRRTIFLGGLVCSNILVLIIGFIGIAPRSSKAASWAIGSLMLVYTFMYDMAIGPVCYSIVSEMSSTRLRAKSIVIARTFYNIVGLINNIITPRMLNPSAWNWGPKSGFFWTGVCFLCVLWAYFRLPEASGRTYAELDKLFELRVSAREFSSTEIHPFEAETGLQKVKVDESELKVQAANCQ